MGNNKIVLLAKNMNEKDFKCFNELIIKPRVVIFKPRFPGFSLKLRNQLLIILKLFSTIYRTQITKIRLYLWFNKQNLISSIFATKARWLWLIMHFKRNPMTYTLAKCFSPHNVFPLLLLLMYKKYLLWRSK